MKNRKWIGWILSLVFMMTTLATTAQETRTLSLQQAIDLSLANSQHLKMANAKMEEATAVLKEAFDNRLPDLKISGSYLRLSSANISLKNGSDSTGGNAGPTVNQALYGMANLSLPLYAGGRIRYGIESARYLQQAARLDAENDKESVVFNTVNAYVNLYKSAEAVKIVKENLHASLNRDSMLSNLEKNGLLARNDLLKSQLQSSRIELTLLDAENNFAQAVVNMNLMLGLPENTALQPDDSFIVQNETEKKFIEYEDAALHNRKDLQSLGFRKKAAATGIQAARAEAFPTIALTGGYIAADIPNFLSITNAVNIGIGVQYNLASLWKTNSKKAQALAREKQVAAGVALLDDDIRRQVNQAYQAYLLSHKKIEVYEKAVIQAAENYRITNNKYNNNLVTITDLLDADVANVQAKLDLSFAKADAVVAYDKLLLSTGSLSK
jgi:outer membrane protein TolC